jgi:zinc protease
MSVPKKTRNVGAVILSGALASSFRPRRSCGVERARSRRICRFSATAEMFVANSKSLDSRPPDPKRVVQERRALARDDKSNFRSHAASHFAQLLFCFLLLTTFAAAQVTPWNKIQAPPLPAFTPPEPTRVQLPNGMVIFLQSDHELPLIEAIARIRGGSVYEPANKTGLVDLYGDVWRTGGTKTKTGDQMDDFLEARAAKIETDRQADSTTISLDCLKGDFDAVFEMFLDLLHNPEFRADKLELAQDQMYTSIARRNDRVDPIVHRESRIITYGKDNPYARVPEYATVAAVTREDLLKWHQQHVHPNNIIFGITGDFDPTAMQAKLEQAFGAWAKGP